MKLRTAVLAALGLDPEPALVAIGWCLVVAGVAMRFGASWALITAGGLLLALIASYRVGRRPTA